MKQEEDCLTRREAERYYAGAALQGMLSECRMGNNLSESDMRKVCAKAALIAKVMADMMED